MTPPCDPLFLNVVSVVQLSSMDDPKDLDGYTASQSNILDIFQK